MSKITALFTIALLLCLALTYAGRPLPAASHTQDEGLATEKVVEAADNGSSSESCEGIATEECLMRGTLTAHVDYIYTQHQKP